MPVDLVMPRLSDTMTEGTVARWLKKPGEPVKRGEPLAEIETDKATMPMEAFEDGTMGPVEVGEGQTVPLGSKIGVLYRAGEKADSGSSAAGGAAPPSPEGIALDGLAGASREGQAPRAPERGSAPDPARGAAPPGPQPAGAGAEARNGAPAAASGGAV